MSGAAPREGVPASTAVGGLQDSRRAMGFGLALGLGLLAFAGALAGVPLSSVGEALGTVRPTNLVAIGLAFGTGHLLRALRQAILVGGRPTGRGLWVHLDILLIGFLAIQVVPARLGELVRPALLRERLGLSLGEGLAIVLVERLLDLAGALGLVVLAGALVEVPPDAPTWPGTGLGALALARRGAMALLLAVGGTTAATAWLGPAILRRCVEAVQGWRLPGRGLLLRVLDLLERAARGLRGVGARRWLGAAGVTVGVWAFAVGMLLLAAGATGLGALCGVGEASGTLGVTLLGGVLPAPPAQAGTFEAFVRLGMAAFGVSGSGPLPASPGTVEGAVLATAILIHWWPLLLQAAAGALALVHHRVDLRALVHGAASAGGEGVA